MVKLYLQDDIDHETGVKLYVSHFDNDSYDYRVSYDSHSIVDLTQEQAASVLAQLDHDRSKYTAYEYTTGVAYDSYLAENKVVESNKESSTYLVKENLRSHVTTGCMQVLTWEARVKDRDKLVRAIEDHVALSANLYTVEGLSISLESGTDFQLLKYFFDNVYKYEHVVELYGIEVTRL